MGIIIIIIMIIIIMIIIIIKIITMMAELAVVLCGLPASNEGDTYGL